MNLAINGGKRITDHREYLWPQYDENTKKEIDEVFNAKRWAISGQWKGRMSKCQTFEQMYSKFNNTNYCVLFDHGSSALVAALQALGVGAGDEVIIPALTWVACIIAVTKVNAIPVIVDVDESTYCISVDKIKSAITENTKVIMPVHLYGCMADMDAIKQVADTYGLYIVEDSSHSHGSIWKSQYAGTIGDIGCFSFQQGKPLTCGEGGAVLVDKEDIYQRLQELRTNSRIYKSEDEGIYDEIQLLEKGTVLGTNYCVTEFQAAILIDQIRKLEKQNLEKEKNAKYLNKYLSEIPGISSMHRYHQIEHQTYYRYCIKVDKHYFANKSVFQICRAISAEIGFHLEQPYIPINKSKLFNPKTLKEHYWSKEYLSKLDLSQKKFPIAEKASKNQGIIFHHSFLFGGFSEMDYIIEAFRKVQKYADEI